MSRRIFCKFDARACKNRVRFLTFILDLSEKIPQYFFVARLCFNLGAG